MGTSFEFEAVESGPRCLLYISRSSLRHQSGKFIATDPRHENTSLANSNCVLRAGDEVWNIS